MATKTKHPLAQKNIYLAGPMTGIAQFNSPEFHAAHNYLLDEVKAADVFNPAANDVENGFNPSSCSGFESKEELAKLGFSLRRALGEDLWWIAENAEAVAVLPGYENSKGVAAELALANALGLPVWYLRKNPDGTFYLREVPAGLGERKESGVLPDGTDKLPVVVKDGLGNDVGKLGGLTGALPSVPTGFSEYDKAALRTLAGQPRWGDRELITGKALGIPFAFKEATQEEIAAANAGTKIVWKHDASALGAELGIENHTNYKNNGEVRVTSATGGQKGSKPERYDLIPVGPLAHLARTYGFGAEKYEDNNWQKGYDWKLSYAALQRHLNAFWGGEDFDPEIGTPHLANAAWHCFTLMWFMENRPEYDSRAKESN